MANNINRSKQEVSEYVIEWGKWEKFLEPKFIPLMEDKTRTLICWGGRGSGKSYAVALKVIYLMLTASFFRGVLVRNTYASIQESSYKAIKDVVEQLGLQELFTFKVQPLKIECWNGNSVLCKGVDQNPQVLKSVNDVSFVWIEEDIVSEASWISINGSMRTKKADYLQTICTLNPQLDYENFEDNWFWKRFFKEHPGEKTFRDTTQIQIGTDKDGTPKIFEVEYYCHHSNYLDNLKHLTDDFVAGLLINKEINPEVYIMEALGEWCNRTTSGLFYKHFSRARNTSENVVYNPEIPLHISFDFNRKPYCSAIIAQITDKNVGIIDEIATVTPNNNTAGVCREIIKKYAAHLSGVYIYGDPSGHNEDTRSEEGWNDYRIIEQELAHYRPQLRIASKHPPVAKRGDFINCVFQTGFDGLYITVNPKLKYLVNDLCFLKEKADGTKNKEKGTKNGETFERLGHHSDCLDYFICEAFKNEFYHYQNGSRDVQRIIAPRVMNTRLRY